MGKINLAFILSLLMIAVGCRSEYEFVETNTELKIKGQKFSIFQKNETTAKGNSEIDFPKSFAFLAQRYDSINKTNITGLINSGNKVFYHKNQQQYYIGNASAAYIEFRLHSQTVFEDNGDVWVLYPRILNNKVEDLVVAVLTEEETKVYYPTVGKNSSLFQENINVFQQAYSKYFRVDDANNVYLISTTAKCGFDGYPECDIQEVIITPPPPKSGGGGGFPIGRGSGDLPGGGCPEHQMCVDDGTGGGGGVPSLSNSERVELLELEQEYLGMMSDEEREIYEKLNALQKLDYLRSGRSALVSAQNKYPSSLLNGKGDAYRHALFSAKTVRTLGTDLSTKLLTAHENQPISIQHPLEKEMDLFNNQIGREIPMSVSNLEAHIQNLVEQGKLKIISPLNSSNRPIDGVSKLVPSNN